MPVDAAEVAAPIRKLWLLKDEPWRAAVKIERCQWLTMSKRGKRGASGGGERGTWCVAAEVEVGT